jgi:hypothetical protein
MQCPKCGFEQKEAPECLRCGVVFSRIHASPSPPIPAPEAPYSLFHHLTTVLLRFYRVFRWVTLAGLIVILFLILHNSPPPAIDISPGASQIAESKIQQFQSSIRQGAQDTLEINQSELNGWLDANLTTKKSEGQNTAVQTRDVASLAKTALNARDPKDSDLQQVQSSIKDVKINLMEDSLRVYVVFESHGMDLSLELEGRPLIQEGCLRLDPTGGKIGSLPLPPGALRKATDSLFDSPQNKEKFRLPSYIRDMRVEKGRLVIVSG